jgi:demethylmenaquinone methyltransferase/2-methoxy-6-polyprenyl-1,4-benzoquinol methylase
MAAAGNKALVVSGGQPDAGKEGVRAMFDRIAVRYDAANRLMSGGIDVLWRRKAMRTLLDRLPERPRVLDLGAGTLDGALEIVRRRPGAQEVGNRKLGAQAVRIAAHAADGHHLPYATGAFDGAFSGFCVRNLRDLRQAMGELRRVVRPGGSIAILEFFRPTRTRLFLDKFWNARVLPLIGWAVTGDRAAYQYLPASIAGFVSRTEYEDILRSVGFAEVEGKDLFPGGVASLVVAR